MARIPEAEIERLKREISLERLVEAKGVTLRKHGADLLGLCPLHDDREPSLVVSPEKNLWHCLGACQTGGSVIDWVMKVENVSFRHAVELLRKDAAIEPGRVLASRAKIRKLSPLAERDADDDALMERVVAYYEATLKESPEAIAYLESRGLHDAELLATFRVGFANRTLGYRLPDKSRKEGAELRGRLERLGVFRESGHEHLRGSVVVPLFHEGRIVGMYGRKIGKQLREGTPNHLYLPGPHRGVWNEAALSQTDDVVLAESLLDAMTFWSAGVRNVIAAYGVEGFTEDHWSALRGHGTRVVRIAYDRDEAGDRAAEKLSKELNAAGIDTYRVLFPKGMDANDYARAVQPANKSLPLAVRRAEWMGKGQRPERAASEAPTPAPVIANDEREASEDRDVAVADTVAAMPEPIPFLAALSEASDGAEAPPPTVPASAPNASTTQSAASVAVEGKGDELVFRFGERRWRVRGLGKNASYEAMRINLHVAHERTGSFHVDTVELYSARQRSAYQKAAASELELEERVIKHDVGSILLELERRQENAIETALRPKTEEVPMTSDERESALVLLRDPFLVRRILEDFEACGVVGEETNKLVGYLAAVSRKLEEPLAIVIQSSSAAGKSRLMEAVLAMVPAEERVSYSAMTGQALFYMGAEDLRHKILAIAEEEGAERASYALKLLQSEGELTIASTGKDPETGKLVTHTYRVEGPVMIFLTTTAIEVDEELLNRCIVLTVDEGTGQTRAIHKQQREAQTLSGLLRRKERTTMRAVHQNAQRLLRPLLVANPFAEGLTFSDLRTRTRRDHMKYLTMIRSIALLHQYQRPLRTVMHEGKEVTYIEVEASDIELANKLARAVLGRSLDELPPQTRALLEKLDALVEMRVKAEGLDRSDVRFSRRDAREWSGMGHTQLCVHLSRLESLEYLVMHRAARGQGVAYELSYAGESAPEVLYDRHAVGGLSGAKRGEVGPESGACRPGEERTPLEKKQGIVNAPRETAPLALNGGRARASSYA